MGKGNEKLAAIYSITIVAMLLSLIIAVSVTVAAPINAVAVSITPDTQCANGRMAKGSCPDGEELPTPTFGPQSSTLAVDWGFDFVETFDGLQDWSAESYTGNRSSVANLDAMPKLSDGGTSAWDYFSNYNTNVPPEPWIAAYGDHRVWRGTKSATIDMQGGQGPSRIGTYFGHGYDKMYVFYMVNFPSSHFPTESPNCADANIEASYTQGQPYKYCSFYKHFVPQVGCPSAECFTDNFGYSPAWNMVFDIMRHGSGKPDENEDGLYFYVVSNNRDSSYTSYYGYDSTAAFSSLIGDWMGIEYGLEITDTTVTIDIWLYDKTGNVAQHMTARTWNTPAAAQGHRWNQIEIGGNKSWRYPDVGMDSTFNIDDVIIDDQRIGPKYFDCVGVTTNGGC